MVEMEYSQKKLPATTPNRVGVKPISCMIGTATLPSTTLSRKLMAAKSANATVMFYALPGW